MTQTIKQITIFISSPSDVIKERKVALKVIDELNSSLCKSVGLSLFHLTWENNTYPAVGEYSQDVINQQIGEYDIFVGIMANRFGTSTPKADSGTEEEFNIAFENREKTHIMFFFKDAPVKPSSLDQKQFKKVTNFRKKIGRKGVYYKQFSKGFERLFRDSLTQYLTDHYIKLKKENSNDPKVNSQTDLLKIDYDDFFKSHNPSYEKYCSINALAIPNSQFKLKDIYVAQTLEKEKRFEEDDTKEAIIIDRVPIELINKYKKILIKDTAGMGKSTIMKYMFIDLIDNCIKDVGIPIYIELNRLNKERTILKEIQKELKFLCKEFDDDTIMTMIQKGVFIFFLDGYDEISIADRGEVTDDIQHFIINAGANNNFILTSRPEDERLASFGDFQSFKIQPLRKDEAFELLTKYDITNEKQVSEELIKELRTDKYRTIDEYLENPLLVSLLYSAFTYKAEIPLKKHLFYRQIYDALYNAHKLAQGQRPHEKRSNLDVDDFNRVLRCVGYDCLVRIGVQFNKDTILNSINRAKLFCGNLEFGASDFLKDLMTSVPLFSKDGNEFKWAHKSLMEYFAACYIFCDAKQNQDSILKNLSRNYNVEKYQNILDLYYDIDFIGFNKSIRYPLCKSFITYYDSLYCECDIPNDLLEERISKLFMCEPAIIKFSPYAHQVYGSLSRENENLIVEKSKIREEYKKQFDMVKENFDNDAFSTVYSFGSRYLYMCFFNRHLLILLNILFRHSDVIITRTSGTTYFRKYEGLLDELIEKEDLIYKIDIKTGEDSVDNYKFFNRVIEIPTDLEELVLDYDACKNVVDSFEKSSNLEGIDCDFDD